MLLSPLESCTFSIRIQMHRTNLNKRWCWQAHVSHLPKIPALAERKKSNLLFSGRRNLNKLQLHINFHFVWWKYNADENSVGQKGPLQISTPPLSEWLGLFKAECWHPKDQDALSRMCPRAAPPTTLLGISSWYPKEHPSKLHILAFAPCYAVCLNWEERGSAILATTLEVAASHSQIALQTWLGFTCPATRPLTFTYSH